MKLITPDYYPQFRCIAGDCGHSCCIGWEIDIDEDSLSRFDTVGGTLGDRLQANIDRSGEVPHFMLGENDRCPFLNSDNLCDLITALGEDCLCQICADHPRFRSEFSDRTEMGLGLCCEAAAALILSREAPVQLIAAGDSTAQEDAMEQAFFLQRDNAIAIAQDRAFSVAERMENLADYFGTPLPGDDRAYWMQLYTELEHLDEGWTDVLATLPDAHDLPPATETPFEQLLVYFLYRHLPTAFQWGDVAAGVWFSILSTQMLLWLSGANPDIPLAELARMYSAEIEYSDENIEILMNLIYEEE